MKLFSEKSKSILIMLICLTYIGMFLPTKVGNIPLIILTLFCAVQFRFKEFISVIKKNFTALLMIGFYLLYVVGFFYSSNHAAGLFALEKKIAFLLFPVIVLPILIKEEIEITQLLKPMGYITIISAVIFLGRGFYKLLILSDDRAFFFEEFSTIHYVFYALYFACGSLFFINTIFNDTKVLLKKIIIVSVSFVFSMFILIIVASKTGILIFIIVSSIFFYTSLSSRRYFWICIMLFMVCGAIMLYVNKTAINRFTELPRYLSVLTQEGPIKDVEVTDLNMRLLFWKISISHLINDQKWLLGVGPGDAQDYIDKLYVLPEYLLYGYIGWDSHNQWVYSFIQLGIIPILLLSLFYGKRLIDGFKKNDFYLICFLLVTLAFSFSESILESNKGILYFTLTAIILSLPSKNSDANKSNNAL